MYAQIDVLTAQEPEAAKFILDNDRLLYRPFFEAAERFCAENNVAIGGKVAVEMMLDQPYNKDSFFWDLYCDDAWNKTKALAGAMAASKSAHIPPRTCAVRTEIKYREFVISVNARAIIRVHSQYSRAVNLVSLLAPDTRPGYFTSEPMRIVRPELQLIDVYRALYSPTCATTWPAMINMEAELYARLPTPPSDAPCGKIITPLHDKIVRKCVRRGRVLIGDYALAAMGLIGAPRCVQIISADGPDVMAAELSRVVGDRIIYSSRPLNLPSDFRLTRLVFYAAGKEKDILMELYNSAEFEMIPTHGNNIAGPFTLMRFIFIDMWRGIIGSDSLLKRARQHAAVLRGHIATMSAADIFPLDNYVGANINEGVAKRKMIKELGERFTTYYPAAAPTSPREERRGAAPAETVPAASIRSAAIDLSADVPTKMKILHKIVPGGPRPGEDIMAVLARYYGTTAGYSRWGIGKILNKFYRKNANFLKYIPPRVDTYVDFGCGDGLDIAAVRQRWVVRTAICADIADNRAPRYVSQSQFVQVQPGDPCPIESGTVNLMTLFHVIHHMTDAVTRLADLHRMLAPGGLLFVKDHDVTDEVRAGNVDFEHLVYDIGAATADVPLDAFISKYLSAEYLAYFPADTVDKMLVGLGLERLFLARLGGSTYVYNAVYRKKI